MENYELSTAYGMMHSTNQLVNQYVYNSSFRQLFNNDLILQKLFDEIYNTNENGIQAYNSKKTYNKGEIIWFKADNHKGIPTLYLLESIIDNNNNVPTLEYEDELYSFDKSGWKDRNEYNTFLNNEVSAYINQILNKHIDIFHNFDKDYHPFSTIKNIDDASKKIMLTDMSNIDKDRNQMFFPFQTFPLQKDNTIIGGYCRQWDNGLLEYDVLFQLGNIGTPTIYNGTTYQTIVCNNLDISGVDSSTKYFVDEKAANMFNNTYECSVVLEDMVQLNRNDYCNSYSGRIQFPIEFADLNYMIFSSSVRSCEKDISKQSIDCNQNSITYINKQKTSIDPLLLLMPDIKVKKGNRNGLVSNNFHCQIVGKWK